MSTARTFAEDGLLVFQVSTTCDEHGVLVPRARAEVIELAWILVDTETLHERARDSVLVRPTTTPITALCSKSYTLQSCAGRATSDRATASATAIENSHVADAGTLQHAVNRLDSFIQRHLEAPGRHWSFVCFKTTDLRVQLPREARDKGLKLPTSLRLPRIYDLHAEYSRWHAQNPETVPFRATSLVNVCAALQIAPISSDLRARDTSHDLGRLNLGSRAGDDCVNMCRVLQALVQRNREELDPNRRLFVGPLDVGADLRAFEESQSCILFLSGLGIETTQSEIESWFTQYGLRPIGLYTMRPSDQPSGTGFAIFQTHAEAQQALSTNGRALAEHTVEVVPSSKDVLDRAASILAPFPPSKNRPRPGDWPCPSCGFSNFQRRTSCFRCSYPLTSTQSGYGNHPQLHRTASYPAVGFTPQTTSMHGYAGMYPQTTRTMRPRDAGPVPFRAGDWSCDSCGFHNFARNAMCLKCSSPRTISAVMQHQQHRQHLPPAGGPTAYPAGPSYGAGFYGQGYGQSSAHQACNPSYAGSNQNNGSSSSTIDNHGNGNAYGNERYMQTEYDRMASGLSRTHLS